MKLINCLLKLGDYSSVKKTNITPAEAALLIRMHRPGAGQMPIMEPVAVGEVERTDHEELDRLRGKYGARKVEAAWPGVTPVLPTDFAQVGVQVAPPKAEIEDEPAAPRRRAARKTEEPQPEG